MTVEQQEEETGPVAPRLGERIRNLAVDVEPLRTSPEYRRLWAGQTVSLMGNQITLVAVPVQVYALTRSSFDVGLLGLVALFPLIASGLLGATLVDAMDRRRLAICTSIGFTAISSLLVVNQVAGWHRVWVLYLAVALQSLLMGMDSPARRAFIPRLLRPDQIAPANALSQISFTAAATAGPLIAGLVIATSGVGLAYLIDVVSFVGSAYALVRLRPMPPAPGFTRAGFASLFEGLGWLRGQPVVLTTFVADIIAMIFGMPRALFPALAENHFHAGPGAVGLLYAAVAAGALVGALFGGWFGRVRRQGVAVLLAIVAWGLAITGFGLTTWLWLGLLFLALAGASDMVSAVYRNTILLQAAPDEMQGRMQGVFIVVVSGGPRLGDLESGSVASIGLEFSVVSGGLVCLAGIALVALLVPSFRRYEAPVAPPPP
ncbi:MAG TPA: MFS transporter [Mycobacteriales bacterium]